MGTLFLVGPGAKSRNSEAAPRPAFTLKDLNFVCWAMFLAFLVLPMGVVAKNAALGRGPSLGGDKDFVFFYSMGRMLNEHSPAQLYDVELQEKIEMEVQPLKDGRGYTPNPYHPYIAILFRPFALLAVYFFLPLPYWPDHRDRALSSGRSLLAITGFLLLACFFAFPLDRHRRTNSDDWIYRPSARLL
jgi:hypothetical protein